MAPQMEEGLGISEVLLETLPEQPVSQCLRVLKYGWYTVRRPRMPRTNRQLRIELCTQTRKQRLAYHQYGHGRNFVTCAG
jgi:hypothetical protein